MSLLGVFIGGVALVAGAAIAVSVIADELSDRERDKQRQMQEDYDFYCSDRRAEYQSTVSGYRSSYQSRRNSYERDFEEERKRRIEELKTKQRPYLETIRNNLQEQRETKQHDLQQLLNILQQWNQIKDKSQSTMLRMKSIRKTILSIEEAVYKLQAYFVYLERYEHNMDYHFNIDGSIPEPFSMTLPKYYPYAGKIIELRKSDFHQENGKYIYSIPEEKNLSLYLAKNETELFENSEQECIPFMVCYNRQTEKLANTISISRARIKQSMDTMQGIYAEVEKVTKNWIRLTYEGVYLSLNRSDMKNPHRSFPKGVYLTVYLISYHFALDQEYPQVSENLEDSLSLASFSNIGMLLTDSQYQKLYYFLQENHWLELEDEWKIGPADINESPLQYIKIQMGEYYGYLAKFETIDGNPEQKMLVFQHMLEKEEFLTFSDVFAAADVTIESQSATEAILPENAKECSFLYAYLTGEFASQKNILKQSPMMQYFEKWTELTKRLIEVLQYQKRCTFFVDSWEQHKKILYIYTSDTALIKFWKKWSQSPCSRFFLRIPDPKRDEYLKCRAEFLEETSELQITVKDLAIEKLISMNLQADFILFNNAGAEKSQLIAFSDFREGYVTNTDVKVLILNPEDLVYHDTHARICQLYNTSIAENAQQFEAVHRAFAVQDYYMIQGPPGTGKTTVIKELIMQQLHANASSKILVVSQANVAVDNVIRGIQKLCRAENCIQESQIIRCGSDGKIAEDILPFSYNGRMEAYTNSLKTTNSVNPELRKKWISFTESPDNRDIVSECLLKGYQIIGATCVGFSNRNIGLSGLEFDLVIIDEAGKALAGELLIPINHAKKLIMIGDHKQLPPVISPELYKSGSVQTEDVLDEEEHLDFFHKSFFQRLWDGCPESNKCMLKTQFRMPPVIAGLVNLFYDGQLKTGSVCYQKKPLAFDNHLVMLDMQNVIDYKEEKEEASGPYNIKEQAVVIEMIQALRAVYPVNKRIVVITPYKPQKRQLIKKLREAGIQNFSVNTIDAFQGDEEEIVIYCMTRSTIKTNYFSDAARLNVAFSRAKNLLVIIGSTKYLKKYGKKHILYQVYQYIQSFGRVIPYSEFSNNKELIYNTEEYAVPSALIDTAEEIPVPNAEDLFELEQLPEKEISVPKCVVCNVDLQSGETILCLSCLNKSTQCHCQKCRKPFPYSNYLLYIEHSEPPLYCEDCRLVKISCDNCRIEFEISPQKIEFLRKKSRQVFCPQCLEEIMVKCDGCGKVFYKIKWQYDKLKTTGKMVYCEECCTMQEIACESCGNPLKIPHYQVQQNLRSKKHNYCQNCWKKTTEICSCGNSFNIEIWRKRELDQKGRNPICPDCRNRYRH